MALVPRQADILFLNFKFKKLKVKLTLNLNLIFKFMESYLINFQDSISTFTQFEKNFNNIND